jgi:hypothetical protein
MTSVRSLGNRRTPISDAARAQLAELVRQARSLENLAVHLASSRATIEQAMSPGALFMGATVVRLEKAIRVLHARTTEARIVASPKGGLGTKNARHSPQDFPVPQRSVRSAD